jgi:hypothetical protein
MRVLVDKRTHFGDPDESGRFGVFDCIGTVRDRDDEAVIGIGGRGAEALRFVIAGIITFEHIVDFGQIGPKFAVVAPRLA